MHIFRPNNTSCKNYSFCVILSKNANSLTVLLITTTLKVTDRYLVSHATLYYVFNEQIELEFVEKVLTKTL